MTRETQRAIRSVYLVFGMCGVMAASLLSRVPQLRDALQLSPAGLGLLMLSLAVGSLASLRFAGAVVHRIGAAKTVAIGVMISSVGIAIVAIGTEVGTAMVAIGLFLFGYGNGQWDVAQNVEGAAVEQRIGRSIMSRFHAAFSLGTVAGALGGAAMNLLEVSPLVHLLAVSVLVAIATQIASRGFLTVVDDARGDERERGSAWQAWSEPRTLLIGVFVLCMALAEGTGNDWLGVAMIDGYGASAAFGSLAYVIFVAAMTAGRWFGPSYLDRHGRVIVMRCGALAPMVGVVIVVFGPSLGAALIGTLLWGIGAALGFSTGMSAAADDPTHAARRVSVVATIGYAAFLAGPAAIGAIGNDTGVLRALTLTAAVLALGAAVAGSTRPLIAANAAEA